MKRSIRTSLRWSLVVTLATALSTGPVAAGWLHRHLHSGSDTSVCAPAPTCCEPAPVPVYCPEPVFSPAPVSCCEPAPCCVDGLIDGISTVDNSSQWGETVLQDSPVEVDSQPAADANQSGSETDQDTDKSSSDKSSSEASKTGTASENPTSTPAPAPTNEDAAGTGANVKKKDAAVVAPPVAAPAPAPKVQPEALPQSDAVDLFNDAAVPGMKLPAGAQPVAPQPVSPPAEESVDDLFGGADEPVMTEPALEPLPPAAPVESESIDDLFGAPPADNGSAPAERAVTPTDPGSIDDLFGAPAAAPATEPTMPAEDAASDDLFGDPSGLDAAPTQAPSDSVDDLFGDPATPPKAAEPATPTTPSEGSDDLFSEPPADDAKEGALDDLFSQWNGDSEVVETAVDSEAAQGSPIASANTLTGLDHTELRTWVDNTGGFRTAGRLVKIGDDYVKLLKDNGKTCTVPRSRLSEEDSDYVESIVQRAALFVMATPGR